MSRLDLSAPLLVGLSLGRDLVTEGRSRTKGGASGLEGEGLQKSDPGFAGSLASFFGYPDYPAGHRLLTAFIRNDPDELSRAEINSRPDSNAEFGEVNRECTVRNPASVSLDDERDRRCHRRPLASPAMGG